MNVSELLEQLKNGKQMLLEASLKPSQGSWFQPTSFPDLGPAEYCLPDGTQMLLVESPQSVANRLEMTIWDEDRKTVIPEFEGISFIEVVKADNRFFTSSILEAHRLNSNYILENKTFCQQLIEELGASRKKPKEPLDFHRLVKVLAKYDFNCLLHGVFFAKKDIAGGRYKLSRALSGFIDARGVQRVTFGGLKKDLIDPQGPTDKGGGNIPYPRMAYTAEHITAYFNLNVAQIHSYRLGETVTDLLIATALWKILKFLKDGLRLRSSCDLKLTKLQVTRPKGWTTISDDEYEMDELLNKLLEELKEMIPLLIRTAREQGIFADPSVTCITYEAATSRRTRRREEDASTDEN